MSVININMSNSPFN